MRANSCIAPFLPAAPASCSFSAGPCATRGDAVRAAHIILFSADLGNHTHPPNRPRHRNLHGARHPYSRHATRSPPPRFPLQLVRPGGATPAHHQPAEPRRIMDFSMSAMHRMNDTGGSPATVGSRTGVAELPLGEVGAQTVRWRDQGSGHAGMATGLRHACSVPIPHSHIHSHSYLLVYLPLPCPSPAPFPCPTPHAQPSCNARSPSPLHAQQPHESSQHSLFPSPTGLAQHTTQQTRALSLPFLPSLSFLPPGCSSVTHIPHPSP